MQENGTVRAEIAGHGQFETRGTSLDELINEHWNTPTDEIVAVIKEDTGYSEYSTEGMSKIELLLIVAELRGLATN